LSEPTDTDWAYAAGLVDGEGCIAVVRFFEPRRDRFYYGVQVVIANTDRAVLEWVEATWGGLVVPVAASGRGERAKDSWAWRCGTPLARSFLVGLQPWLRIKVKQCQNALTMAELLQKSRRTLGRARLPQAWLDEQERHYWIQRELNHRGSGPFTKKAMHSPRLIHRLRAEQA
jgi:hypothetical protein